MIRTLFILEFIILTFALSCVNLGLTEAYRQYSVKNYEKSLHHFLEYIQRNPNDAKAWYFIGEIYCKQKKYKKMNNAFDNSLKISSKYDSLIIKTRNRTFKIHYDSAISNYENYNKMLDKNSFYAQRVLKDILNDLSLALQVKENESNALNLKEKITKLYSKFNNRTLSSKIDIPQASYFPLLKKGKNQNVKKNLAILDLSVYNIPKESVIPLTNRLFYEIFNTKRFIILEREKIKEILQEQAFQMSGCTSSECLVEAGKLLNVEYMLGGTVSKIDNLYSIDLRLIEVETGKIISIAKADINGKLTFVLKYGLGQAVNKLLIALYEKRG